MSDAEAAEIIEELAPKAYAATTPVLGGSGLLLRMEPEEGALSIADGTRMAYAFMSVEFGRLERPRTKKA